MRKFGVALAVGAALLIAGSLSLEGRSDERGQIGGVARDGQEVLADREGGVRRVGQALPAGLHLEMRSVPVRVSSLLAA